MGITNFSIEKLDSIIEEYKPKSVIDLGDQQTYVMGERYGQYANWYYESKGIESYDCIDINGNNNALVYDFSVLHKFKKKYDLLTDCGFSEHVGINGAFAWEAIYNCWLNKHNLLKVGGIMFNENPQSGNWPGHGFSYYSHSFYYDFVKMAGYNKLDLDIHPAMGNTTDGWNVVSTLKKTGNKFPSLEEFKTLDLRTV